MQKYETSETHELKLSLVELVDLSLFVFGHLPIYTLMCNGGMAAGFKVLLSPLWIRSNVALAFSKADILAGPTSPATLAVMTITPPLCDSATALETYFRNMP